MSHKFLIWTLPLFVVARENPNEYFKRKRGLDFFSGLITLPYRNLPSWLIEFTLLTPLYIINVNLYVSISTFHRTDMIQCPPPNVLCSELPRVLEFVSHSYHETNAQSHRIILGKGTTFINLFVFSMYNTHCHSVIQGDNN